MARFRVFQCSLASAMLTVLSMAPIRAQTLQAGDSFRDCSDCPVMVVVPAGKAKVGSTPEERARFTIPKNFADRESPQIDVTIAKPFAVARYEVTRGMYAQYVREAGVKTEPGCAAFDPKSGLRPMNPALSWQEPGFKQGDDEPVVCLNWPDAKGFVAWLGKKTGKPYRLLTETEWEYAARGGSAKTYPWGDNPDVICEKANVHDNPTAAALGDPEALADNVCPKPRKKTFTEPVGSYLPNAYGLYDMLGNAWELVEDCATDTYDGVPTDGSAFQNADCKKRMPRGGGWNSRAWTARLATRGQGPEAYRAVALGMRVARDLSAADIADIRSADPGAGLFQRNCSGCHLPEIRGYGLTLAGIIGRRAGSVPGIDFYSKALKDSGIAWDSSRLSAYLADPAKFVAGTTKKVGAADPKERELIIAYLVRHY